MDAETGITGVSELVLEVLDLDRAERFYSEALGLPVVARGEESGRIWLMAGAQTRIGLWRPQVGLENGRGGVHVHFALHIDELAFDAAVRRLRDAGSRPAVISFEDEGQGRAAYTTDPDGNVVELWTWNVRQYLRSE
jgi:catechol 2,3-dioxygenase-like lactoylglutathione lyase family enzyme